MRRNSFRLPVRLLGIPVRLDGSFLLVLPLFAWLIGSQIPSYAQMLGAAGIPIDPAPLQRGWMPVLLGLTAALGLFASVLVHEIGHALAARRYGVEVREITLWFLGGMARFDELPTGRGAEAVVAIVGPITSFALALLFGLAFGAAGADASPALLFVLSYLAVTNAFLAMFNLLPALPLDGGRVLRSLLALQLGQTRATRIAVGISRGIALLMGVWGFLTFQIFLVVIAFFVWNAGAAEGRAALVTDAFEGLTAADLMTHDALVVEDDLPVESFLRLAAYRSHVAYPVAGPDGRLRGVALMAEARAAPEGASVASLVRPAETIEADAEALEAVRRISTSPLGRLVVLDDRGGVAGIISKSDVLRHLPGDGRS